VRLKARQDLVAGLERLVQDRTKLASDYAKTFRQELQAKIDGSRQIIAFLSSRVELEQAQADRMAKLAKAGAGSLSAMETAMGLVIEHQRLLTETQTALRTR